MEKDKVYANLADIARMLEIASKLGRLATGLGTEGEAGKVTICGVAGRGHGGARKNIRGCEVAAPPAIVDVQPCRCCRKNRMTPWERYFLAGRGAGCPKAQMDRFASADVILQARQLAASAAARLCDAPTGRWQLATAGRAAAANHTGYWRKWGRMTASACRA